MGEDHPGMGVLRPFHPAVAADRIFCMGYRSPDRNKKNCRKDQHPGQPGIYPFGHAGFLQALDFKHIIILKMAIKNKSSLILSRTMHRVTIEGTSIFRLQGGIIG
jgi:hypothetical protein